MAKQTDSPSVLHSVAGLLSRQVTTDQLLKAMVDRVVEELDAERGTLFLLDAITGERRKPHVIDQTKCTKCGTCLEKCPFTAVMKV